MRVYSVGVLSGVPDGQGASEAGSPL
eukprot:SAG22_NODE_14817_length_364_cov_0.781132_1_plen_25_part_10